MIFPLLGSFVVVSGPPPRHHTRPYTTVSCLGPVANFSRLLSVGSSSQVPCPSGSFGV